MTCKLQSLLLMPVLLCGCASEKSTPPVSQSKTPVDYVNPLVGTDSKPLLSNGNTYPAIALPWGMNFWTPQTGKMRDGWAYTYASDKIRGFKQTHQPSPWINDYAQFSLMPVTGEMKIDQDSRASWFSHKAETATPYYYNVYLSEYDVTTEITPTERCAMFRFTFPETDNAYIVLDAFDGGSSVKVLPEEQKIVGYVTNNSGGVPENFKNYFILEFDKPFETQQIWKDYKPTTGSEITDNHVGAVVGFKTKRGEQVNVRVSSSFISEEQAKQNMRELGNASFEEIKSQGRDRWNDVLGRIEVNDNSDTDRLKTFYSCLYRSVLFPRSFYEIDANGQVMHYSPYNGEVLPGYMFTEIGRAHV